MTFSVGLITALIAAITALLGSLITYLAMSRRDNLQARIEICKYREKWLEQLRNEFVELNTIAKMAIKGSLSSNDTRSYFNHLSKINLLVGKNNAYWEELNKSMTYFTKKVVLKNLDQEAKPDKEFRPFLLISKDILKEEWDEIQGLLYKRKRKNAKNQ